MRYTPSKLWVDVRRNLCRLLFAGGATAILTGCTGFEVHDQSLQFNRAVGDVDNALLLLNAVRVAKDYPTQFTAIGSYTGTGRASGGVDLQVPFLARRVGAASGLLQGSVSPNVDFGSGITSLQLLDLDTKEAQQALKREASFEDYRYYLRQGWNFRLTSTVMIQSVLLHWDIFRAIADRYDQYCSGAGRDNVYCLGYKAVPGCDDFAKLKERRIVIRNTEYASELVNDPASRCEYVQFQRFLDALSIAGGVIDLDPPAAKEDECPSSRKLPPPPPAAEQNGQVGTLKLIVSQEEPKQSQKSAVPRLYFPSDPGLQAVLAASRKRDKCKPFEVVFRSAESMVRFLGKIIKAQHFVESSYVPQILIERNLVDIFRVDRGRADGPVAFSVNGPEGERFSIPGMRDEGRPHLSLLTLSLVMEFLSSAISGVNFPASPALFIGSD